MKKISLALACMLLTLSTFAQSSGVDMATGLRSSGKIWVVVGVVLTIVIGMFIFLFTIDSRVKKLENR